MQPAGGAVEPGAVGLVRRELVERIRLRVHRVEVLALQLDRDQDVAHVDRVALGPVDADQMIPEGGRHRLRQRADGERAQARKKPGIEPGLVPFHPPQIAAPGGAPRVRRLLLRHVLELRLPARDLGAHRARPGEGRRGVGGVGYAGHTDVAQPGRGRPLEIVPVRLVRALELGVGHGGEGVRDVLGPDGEQGDGHRLVLVAPDAPQPRVRHVEIRRQVLLELALRQIGAVQLLDLRRELGPRAREIALPLGDIELAVRLEGRILHHLLQDLRRRPAPRRLDDLLI